MRYYEEILVIDATPGQVFGFADDHQNFTLHMNQASLMMGGGRMETMIDAGKGKQLGSHIKMSGKVMGLSIYLDEIITERIPPTRKVWETVGTPRLLVVGKYILGFEITPKGKGSNFKVFIHYDLPLGPTRILGLLFGSFYARWCVAQMTQAVSRHFS